MLKLKYNMKQLFITGILVFFLTNIFSQRDVVLDEESSSQIQPTMLSSVSDEITKKYGKGTSISEYLIVKVREYEETNNVKVVSKEEFDENLKLIKQLKNELTSESDPGKRQNIGRKITYIENRRVKYESIEAELLR